MYGWGLSLGEVFDNTMLSNILTILIERPTMIKYKVNNIRELLGHKVDLGFIETNAAVRLDKN